MLGRDKCTNWDNQVLSVSQSQCQEAQQNKDGRGFWLTELVSKGSWSSYGAQEEVGSMQMEIDSCWELLVSTLAFCHSTWLGPFARVADEYDCQFIHMWWKGNDWKSALCLIGWYRGWCCCLWWRAAVLMALSISGLFGHLSMASFQLLPLLTHSFITAATRLLQFPSRFNQSVFICKPIKSDWFAEPRWVILVLVM